MTTAKSTQKFRLPDPPEREPDDLTSFDHLTLTGSVHHLIQHFGNPETTLVVGEHYLSRVHGRDLTGVRYPDLLIAFGVSPAAYYASNAYIIAEQGKPPDFVLEIASRRTGRIDVVDKRNDYAALGIPEYWRFDETGQHHRTRLAGDRLAADGQYQPISIEEMADGVLQGYSRVLNLLLRWENGQLRWHDPETGRHIATFEDEREARIQAEARVREQREALIREREARIQAEARVRELEERLENPGN
jgi:Uma2 family endonuclease